MKFISSKIILFFSLGLFLALTSCAKNISPNTYSGSEVGVVSKVKKGVIVSERAVSINNASGNGGIAGTVAGAAGGAALGGNASTAVMGGVGGAVVGGVVGHVIDQGVNHHQGYEYIIRLQEGETVSVTQTEDLRFSPGQPVLVIYGAMTRIISDQ